MIDEIAFVEGDIRDFDAAEAALKEYGIDTIVNFAAESHNSLAVLDPGRFFSTNVIGTQTMLEAARRSGVGRFHHISTCEVYGDLALDSDESFNEECPYRPRTPYNASKAGSDHAVRAYSETYELPVTITNCANNYGPYQFPEKVIPVFTTRALADQVLPLYASTQNKREWLHVDDHCRAIEAVLLRGRIGETYHVGSGIEASIEEIADAVLAALGKPQSLKTIVPDRPGHDRRYLLDTTKIRTELGWEPTDRVRGRDRRHRRVVRAEQGVVGAAARASPRGRDQLGRGPEVASVRILITGAGGQVGRDLSLVLSGAVPPAGAATALMGQPPVDEGEFEVHGLDRSTLDVTDRGAVLGVIGSIAPDVVVHLAAYTAVDRAEDDPEGARAVNELGTAHVAEAAQGAGAHLIYVSTDYVFAGDLGRALVESDATGPRSVYGATKLAGEARCGPGASILRTSWVAGVWNRTVITLAVESAAAGHALRFVGDQVGSPTASADLAAGIVAFIRERPTGIFHVAGSGAASWHEVIAYAYGLAGGDPELVSAIATEDLDPPQRATRPRYSALVSERLGELGASPLPDWHEGIGRLVAAIASS